MPVDRTYVVLTTRSSGTHIVVKNKWREVVVSCTELGTELQHGFNRTQLAQLKDFLPFQGLVKSCLHFNGENKLVLPADVATRAAGCSLGPRMPGEVACSGY